MCNICCRGSLRDLLPAWLMASPKRDNIDLNDGDEDDQSTFVFPFAVVIAECLDIVDNLAWEIRNVLEGIEYFLTVFQMLATMLHGRRSHTRVITQCVSSSEFARYQHLIEPVPLPCIVAGARSSALST